MNATMPVPAAPDLHTRRDLDHLLENIVLLQRERDELRRAQENEIAIVRQRYRATLTELENFLALETGWVEAWARKNPEAFTADRMLVCAHATIGFRTESPRVERASRRWTWSRIAHTLGELAWGRRYLRMPEPEVDQEALAADLGKLSPDELRAAGMIVVQADPFYLTPHATTAAWQEAA